MELWCVEVWYGGNIQCDVGLLGPPNPPNMDGLGVTTLITSDNITAQTPCTAILSDTSETARH